MPHVWSKVPHSPQECAEVAQLVEQSLRKRWVGGSNPPFGSNFKAREVSPPEMRAAGGG